MGWKGGNKLDVSRLVSSTLGGENKGDADGRDAGVGEKQAGVAFENSVRRGRPRCISRRPITITFRPPTISRTCVASTCGPPVRPSVIVNLVRNTYSKSVTQSFVLHP